MSRCFTSCIKFTWASLTSEFALLSSFIIIILDCVSKTILLQRVMATYINVSFYAKILLTYAGGYFVEYFITYLVEFLCCFSGLSRQFSLYSFPYLYGFFFHFYWRYRMKCFAFKTVVFIYFEISFSIIQATTKRNNIQCVHW